MEIEFAIISPNESDRIRKIFGSIFADLFMSIIEQYERSEKKIGRKRITTRQLCEKSANRSNNNEEKKNVFDSIKGTEQSKMIDTVNLPPSRQAIHSLQLEKERKEGTNEKKSNEQIENNEEISGAQ